MIFFTADHHLGHENIIHFTNRPFANIDEMDTELIRRWNETVSHGDEVYHLGDFTLSGKKSAREYFAQLNGKISILGYSWHHDRRWLPSTPEYHSFVSRTHHPIRILPPMIVLEFKELGNGGHPLTIVLCHYPMARWEKSHFGSYHLHGHSHCNYKSFDPEDRIMDVGVDCNNYKPVSIEDVVGYMAV